MGDELNVKDLELSTNEIFTTFKWYCEMYMHMGAAKAHNLKNIKDETTGEMWDEPKLNKAQREFIKNSKQVVKGNYKSLDKGKKKKVVRKPVLKEDGTVQNNFALPIILSKNAVDFFNTVDLGKVEVKGKQAPLQKMVSGLNDAKHIVTTEIVQSLFGSWIFYSELKDTKGKVIQRGMQDKKEKGKVYVDRTFAKYFAKEIQMILDSDVKNKPIKAEGDNKVVIDGREVDCEYIMPYPIFVVTLSSKVRNSVQFTEDKPEDKANLEKLNARLKGETTLLKEYKNSLKPK